MPSYCWICRKYLKTNSMDKRLKHMEDHGYDNLIEREGGEKIGELEKHLDGTEKGRTAEPKRGFQDRVS